MANKLQQELERSPVWQDAFRSSCLRVGFGLALSRPMCEFISAVADGVQWDRGRFGSAAAFPDNFLATAASLIKRGLIREDRGPEYQNARDRAMTDPMADLRGYTHWKLTAAGEYVVGLLKLAGLFVEADAATEKKARNGRA